MQATAYIQFDKLPRSVFGFTTEGSTQTSSGIVVETKTCFANTRNSEGVANVDVAINFHQTSLRLDFSSYASDRSNQGFCTWEITVKKDLDHYFTD